MFDASQVAAVLFDIDGTLADSDDAMVDAIARPLSRLGWPAPHQAARRLVMAFETPVNWAITLHDRLGLDRRPAGRECPEPATGDQPGRFRLVPGVPAMLRELAGRYPMAIVTTRSHSDTDSFLAQFELASYFGAVVTRGNTRRIKPHPGPIQRAADMLAVPVGQCLMVGDTTPDIVAARRAGAFAVAVLCGYGKRGELHRAGAHEIIEHTALLSTLLQPTATAVDAPQASREPAPHPAPE